VVKELTNLGNTPGSRWWHLAKNRLAGGFEKKTWERGGQPEIFQEKRLRGHSVMGRTWRYQTRKPQDSYSVRWEEN